MIWIHTCEWNTHVFQIFATRTRWRTRGWRALIIWVKIHVIKTNSYKFNVKSKLRTVAEVHGLMSLFVNAIFQFDHWKYKGYTLLYSFAASKSISLLFSKFSFSFFFGSGNSYMTSILPSKSFKFFLYFHLQNFVFHFFSNIFKSSPIVLIFDEGFIDIISKLLMYKTFS